MVQLLELPAEIFEIIIEAMVTSSKTTIVHRSDSISSREQRAALGRVLALRLVHSRFRAVMDDFVFQGMHTLIGTWGLTNVSRINRLLGRPLVARYVKHLQIRILEEMFDSDEPISATVYGLLHHAEQLEALCVRTSRPCDGRPITHFRTGIFTASLNKLQLLKVQDRCAIICLQQLLQAAPALSDLILGPFENFDLNTFLPTAEDGWDPVWKLGRPLQRLSIYTHNGCELHVAALIGVRSIDLSLSFYRKSLVNPVVDCAGAIDNLS